MQVAFVVALGLLAAFMEVGSINSKLIGLPDDYGRVGHAARAWIQRSYNRNVGMGLDRVPLSL